MRTRRILASLSLATATAASAMPSAGVQQPVEDPRLRLSVSADPSISGRWSAPFSEQGLFDERPPATKDEAAMLPAAVSMAMSPDGTVIYWNGVEEWEDPDVHTGLDAPERTSRSRILDLRRFLQGEAEQPVWVTPRQERGIGPDLFCSDLRNLADGRLLVVGGTEYTNEDASLGLPGARGRTELWGSEMARLYDSDTGSWTEAQPMNNKRWYPSLITLADGKMFVAGGVERAIYNDKLSYVNETETFDPRTGRWTDNGASGKTALPYYARLHLLPTGKVLYDGSGQMWGPFGSTLDMVEWNKQKLYDPASRSWADAGVAPLGGRSGSFSAMLPIKAPYKRAQILVVGGTLGPATPGAYLGTDLTEILTVTDDSIARAMGPSLNNRRWFATGVVLPSGEVVALNGGDRDETVSGGMTTPVQEAEMFDGQTWVPLAPSGRVRIYHHTAILLGDGSILVGGHAPLGFGPLALPPDDYTKGAFASTLRDPSFEIFKPPYLFRGARPRLVAVRSGMSLGDRFKITTPDARKITSVVLSRLPSVTHVADVDQRTIALRFNKADANTIRAQLPKNGAVTPPGHYYMFLTTDNGLGQTPSRAAIVQVGSRDASRAPMPFGV